MQKIYETNWPHCAGIYCIKNIENNKRYVGSAVNLFKRLRRHNRELVYQYHPNEHLLKSYNKYGKDAFEVEILEQFDIIEYTELLKIEDNYIIQWKLCDPKFGYNKRENFTFPELSQQSIQVRKEKHDETKIKVMAFKADTGEFYKEFNSVTEAAKELKDQTTNISKCCSSLTRSCKGYTFIKSCDYDSSKNYAKQKISRIWTEEQKEKALKNNTRKSNVWVYDNHGKQIGFYLTMKKCEKAYSLPEDGLSHVFKRHGNIIQYKMFLFCKTEIDLDDFEELWDTAYIYLPGVVRNQYI